MQAEVAVTTNQERVGEPVLRHDWTQGEVEALFARPFSELLYQAQTVHRRHFDPSEVQVSSLLSVKTGACSEDCAYCPQSAHHETGLKRESLMPLEEVLDAARRAKSEGATRFCMGAAWRSPRDGDLDAIAAMVEGVKALGMETCVTAGMLSDPQTRRLKEAGLDYYNHNLDTSESYYGEIITTRTYQDRLDTLQRVRDAGMHVCCGGIVGMGESAADRAGLLIGLANLPRHPESVPINLLVKVEGTPLADAAALDPLDFVRTVAVARIMMPASRVRLSAGRSDMSDEMQVLCFLAGANSIFYGEKLLTTENPQAQRDKQLFARLGLRMAGLGC
ncbi:biotin synthase BioB [Methylococcus mesophilus]|uniref:biotin synthase BioB n=1 Tax=Methylococcus mesophilus TaxID=2993564 RepID=UPI00224B6D91|nr:biotin synthase BioB [Methylococcus mesophilus]UZR28683.1 biotin synthase BioB [Methylococcus mesophilus]